MLYVRPEGSRLQATSWCAMETVPGHDRERGGASVGKLEWYVEAEGPWPRTAMSRPVLGSQDMPEVIEIDDDVFEGRSSRAGRISMRTSTT